MKKHYYSLITVFLFCLAGKHVYAQNDTKDINWVEEQLSRVVDQYSFFTDSLIKINSNYSLFPRAIDERDGSIRMVNGENWVSGFLCGSLWLLYNYTNNLFWAEEALKYCETLLEVQVSSSHPVINCDLGFIFFTALYPAYQHTNDVRFRNKLIEAANALKGRFNPIVGATDSWDFGSYADRFYVIIDNMMSMDLLFWATAETEDSSYYNIAITHANTMIRNQYRDDYSSFNAEYDSTTGVVIGDTTHKHEPDQPAWSRGQAWGFNAFTMYYEEVNNISYLGMAENIAGFWLGHKNLPADYVPLYYISNPDPEQYKDASATAIFCDGLMQLSQQSDNNHEYLEFATNSLISLSSDAYFSKTGQNNGFLLMHATGGTNEHDVSLIYADYYYIRSLMRLREILNTTSNFQDKNRLSFESNFNLRQNYPNPFNGTTIIEFTNPEPANVRIEIFNSLGQKIKTLINNHFPAGQFKVRFHGANLANGVYFYRIQTAKFQEVKKMIMIM